MNDNITMKNVYVAFRKAKCLYFNREYYKDSKFPPVGSDKWTVRKKGSKRAIRIFDTKEEARAWIKNSKGSGYRRIKRKGKELPTAALDSLYTVSNRFNTRWKDINLTTYMNCGFELFGKTFYHGLFIHEDVLKLYIQKDKAIKIQARINKEQMNASAMWVKRYMKDWMIPSLFVYCNSRVGNRLLPVTHYLENRVDAFFLTWLIKDKLVILNEDERAVLPYVVEKYRENVLKLEEIQTFLIKLRRLL